jgi:teichuronic acid biosynthesis glycosyltransferase TuaC
MVFAKRLISNLRKLGLNIEEFGLKSRHNVVTIAKEWLRIRRVIHRFKPDIIHAHYGAVTALFCAVASLRPLIVSFHGSDLNSAAGNPIWTDWLRHFCSHVAVLRAAHAITVNNALKQSLRWGNVGVSVIPVGVDLDLFHCVPQDEARRKLGWPLHEKKVLMYVGNDPVGKGLTLGQQAVDKAKLRYPDLELHILETGVPFEQMPLYYSAADCLIVCSLQESGPSVVKEAAACDLPVVSVDVGMVSLLLRDVQSSRIVARNPDDIAEGLVEVLREGGRSNGRSAVANLSETREAEKVLELYRSIAH